MPEQLWIACTCTQSRYNHMRICAYWRLIRADARRTPEFRPRKLRGARLGVDINTRLPDAFAGTDILGSYDVRLAGLATSGSWIADEGTWVHLLADAPDEIEQAVNALACGRRCAVQQRGVLARAGPAFPDAVHHERAGVQRLARS